MLGQTVTILLRRTAAVSMMTVVLLSFLSQQSMAADIRVFTSGAPSAVQKVIARRFTKATGYRVLFTAAIFKEIRKQLAGDKPDVVVLPTRVMERLEKSGVLMSGSRVDLARVGIGAAIRNDAPRPNISTVNAFRNTMLKARSIVYPDPKGGGFTGAHVARVFAKLGIAEAIKSKVILMYAFKGGVAKVASGGAEIGLFNISEIVPVKGVALAGPIPKELQHYLVFAGAIGAGSSSPGPAAEYLRWLAAPSARNAWKQGGFEALGTK